MADAEWSSDNRRPSAPRHKLAMLPDNPTVSTAAARHKAAKALMSFLDTRKSLAAGGIGKSVPRREDARLLTGRGRYADDFSVPGQAHACVVRSPYAHAKIVSIGVADANGVPGVLAVLIGTDAANDGLRPIPHSPVPANPHEVPLRSRDGSDFFIAPHPVLAADTVRYVGEPVAVVIAETLAAAIDAAERVRVVYRPLAAVAK